MNESINQRTNEWMNESINQSLGPLSAWQHYTYTSGHRQSIVTYWRAPPICTHLVDQDRSRSVWTWGCRKPGLRRTAGCHCHPAAGATWLPGILGRCLRSGHRGPGRWDMSAWRRTCPEPWRQLKSVLVYINRFHKVVELRALSWPCI